MPWLHPKAVSGGYVPAYYCGYCNALYDGNLRPATLDCLSVISHLELLHAMGDKLIDSSDTPLHENFSVRLPRPTTPVHPSARV